MADFSDSFVSHLLRLVYQTIQIFHYFLWSIVDTSKEQPPTSVTLLKINILIQTVLDPSKQILNFHRFTPELTFGLLQNVNCNMTWWPFPAQ